MSTCCFCTCCSSFSLPSSLIYWTTRDLLSLDISLMTSFFSCSWLNLRSASELVGFSPSFIQGCSRICFGVGLSLWLNAIMSNTKSLNSVEYWYLPWGKSVSLAVHKSWFWPKDKTNLSVLIKNWKKRSIEPKNVRVQFLTASSTSSLKLDSSMMSSN